MIYFFRPLCLVVFVVLGLSTSSCNANKISSQTDYITRQSRASYYVETPDPFLYFPEQGQRLLIHWSLPDTYRASCDIVANVTIRFKNNTQEILFFPIHKLSGTHTYTFTGQEFIETKGIATYKIELAHDGCVFAEWRHQLWVDLISLQEDPVQDEEC